ncbi:MAG: FeoB-associated Cys-rich membrane protein [Planctomycetes bacterium]|nr:FeoB-associated Cys-rich membrane protein [Planctomycetota bacterium]
MNPLTQELLVGAIILAAGLYIGLRSWRVMRGRKTGCGCAECPALKGKPKS